MKIRMKTLLATPTRTLHPDQVADLPEDEAQALVDGGFALPADADPSRVKGASTPASRKEAAARAKADKKAADDAAKQAAKEEAEQKAAEEAARKAAEQQANS